MQFSGSFTTITRIRQSGRSLTRVLGTRRNSPSPFVVRYFSRQYSGRLASRIGRFLETGIRPDIALVRRVGGFKLGTRLYGIRLQQAGFTLFSEIISSNQPNLSTGLPKKAQLLAFLFMFLFFQQLNLNK